jgi:hypothetical protein
VRLNRIAIAALALSGCGVGRDLATEPYRISNVKPGYCQHHFERSNVLDAGTRMEVCRLDDGRLILIPEDVSNSALDAMNSITGATGTIISHIVVPVPGL